MTDASPKDEVAATDELTTLMSFLGHQRAFLERKAVGLTEAQARIASCPPSDLTLLGLIRHVGEVERYWAKNSFAGLETGSLYYGEAHPEGDPDGDFHAPKDATIAEALEVWRDEAANADEIYRVANLDDIERSDRAFYSLRWILIHLIEEYARHLGHADLLREAIDGETGE
jgi:hypothetical protein